MGDQLTQKQFDDALKELRANRRKPNADGMLELTQEEGFALFRFLTDLHNG